MKATVRWKPGSRVKADVEQAQTLIDENRAKYGNFNAEALWRSQKNKSAPLHHEFEWDKEAAWIAHNNSRAQYIVRSIETVAVDPANPENEIVVRAYEIGEGGADEYRGKKLTAYRNTLDMLADPEGRDLLIKRAIHDVQTFRRKYAALTELSGIITSMDEFLDGTNG